MSATALHFDPTPERRIYVAVLADYNAGRLTGRWIDCDDLDDMETEVANILRSSKFPNVMVDCPDCEDDDGSATGCKQDGSGEDCPTCKGRGKVPSAEEYAIHDHEGFGDLIGEYTPLDVVARWAEVLNDCHDPEALIAFASYEDRDGTPEDIEEDFKEVYLGQFDTLTEWAEEWAEETGLLEGLPDNLRGYFDVEKWARHQEIDWVFTVDAHPGVYVFRRDY